MFLELCRLALALSALSFSYKKRGFFTIPWSMGDCSSRFPRPQIAINLKASKLVALEVRNEDLEHFIPIISFFQENFPMCPLLVGRDTFTFIFRENPKHPIYNRKEHYKIPFVKVKRRSLFVEPSINDSERQPMYPHWAEGGSLLEIDPPVLPSAFAIKLGFRSLRAKSRRKTGEVHPFFQTIDNAEKGHRMP